MGMAYDDTLNMTENWINNGGTVEENTLRKFRYLYFLGNKKEKKEIEMAATKSKDKVFYYIFREFLGYGPIDILMEDDDIEDISCDGHQVPIFLYHKKYEAISTNIYFFLSHLLCHQRVSCTLLMKTVNSHFSVMICKPKKVYTTQLRSQLLTRNLGR